MTQPYPSTHTADIKHAKASAATRLRSSRLVGSFVSDCGLKLEGILYEGLFNRWRESERTRKISARWVRSLANLFRGDKHDTRSLSYSCPIRIL